MKWSVYGGRDLLVAAHMLPYKILPIHSTASKFSITQALPPPSPLVHPEGKLWQCWTVCIGTLQVQAWFPDTRARHRVCCSVLHGTASGQCWRLHPFNMAMLPVNMSQHCPWRHDLCCHSSTRKERLEVHRNRHMSMTWLQSAHAS